MNKQIVTTILISLVAFLVIAQPAQATQVAARKISLSATSRASHVYQPRADIYVAGSSALLKTPAFQTDTRVEQLAGFLDAYHSPLAPYAANFIAAADQHQLNWKLVPAITGVESTFGKQIPVGSYNAYGWSNGAYRFKSWEQSIDYVSRYLKEKYIDRGLDNPYKIGPVYAPPSPTWAGKITYFMNQIACFDQSDCFESLPLTI